MGLPQVGATTPVVHSIKAPDRKWKETAFHTRPMTIRKANRKEWHQRQLPLDPNQAEVPREWMRTPDRKIHRSNIRLTIHRYTECNHRRTDMG